MSPAAAGAPLLIERWKDRAFYTGMAVAVIATTYSGFARSYFLRSRYFPTPLAPIAKVHGSIFVSWTVLFLVQTFLVMRRRTDLHRRLGVAGAVLAGAMVIAGTTSGIRGRGEGEYGRVAYFVTDGGTASPPMGHQNSVRDRISSLDRLRGSISGYDVR